MSFQPNPGDSIRLYGTDYLIGEHPAAPGLAYAQAGRQGIVYQLIPHDGDMQEMKALKVFFPKYRIPAMVYQSEQLDAYSALPGLSVCKRHILTPEKNGGIIQSHTDLLYAVLMPWVHGPTWLDMIAAQRALTRRESLELATSLAQICSGMEQKGLAHCDLSAPNVLLPFFSEVNRHRGGSPIELVDVEQMYSPKLDRPDVLLAGSPGYAAHRTVQSGLWSAYADRFAGAIILAEMLGWSDDRVIGRAWGESYFDQHEMQTACERYGLMKRSLEERWGSKVAELFVRAWESQDLSSCPTFGEWLIILSGVSADEPLEAEPQPQQPSPAASGTPAGMPGSEPAGQDPVPLDASQAAGRSDPNVTDRLFNQARELEQKGQWQSALEVYRSAHHFVSAGSPMEVELSAAIAGLEERLRAEQAPPGKRPGNRRRTAALLAAGIVVLLLGASPLVYNMLQADALKAKEQQEALVAKQREEAELARKQAEEEARRKQEEEARLAAQREEEAKKEQERKKLEQQKLAEKKRAEQKKKEEERKKLQEKYDKQAKYEKYLQWKQQQAEAQKRKQEEEARKRKEQEELKRVRERDAVLLVASYNKTYNSAKRDNHEKARKTALEFAKRYEKDPDYFNKKPDMSARAGHIYKYLKNREHELPDI